MLSFGNINDYNFGQTTGLRIATRRSDSVSALGEIGKGFGAGVDQLQALGGGAYALLGDILGSEQMFQDGIDFYQEQMEEAAEAEIGRVEDVEGFGDAVLYGSYLVGNVVPTLLGGLGTGAIAGGLAKVAVKKKIKDRVDQAAKEQVQKVVKEKALKGKAKQYGSNALKKLRDNPVRAAQATGAFTYSATLNAGESTANLYEEANERDPALSLAVGVSAGALDAFVPINALKRLLPSKQFKEAKDQISDQIITNKKPIRRVFTQMGKLGGAEGVTEAVQEIIQQSAVEYVIGKKDPTLQKDFLERLFDEENRSVYLNAAIAGAVGGGIVGIPTGIVGDPTPTRTLDEAVQADQDNQEQPTPEATETEDPEVTRARNRREAARRSVQQELGEDFTPRSERLSPEQQRERATQKRQEARDRAIEQVTADQMEIDPVLARIQQLSPEERRIAARENARKLLDRTTEYRITAQNIIEDEFATHIAELESQRGGVRDLVVSEQTPQNVRESLVTPEITKQTQESLQQNLNRVIEQAREAGLNVSMLTDVNQSIQDQMATRIADMERDGRDVAVSTREVEQDVERRISDVERENQERRIARDANALTGETIDTVNVSEINLSSLPLEIQQVFANIAQENGIATPTFISIAEYERAINTIPLSNRSEVDSEGKKIIDLQEDQRKDQANQENYFSGEVTTTPTPEDNLFLADAIRKVLRQNGDDYNDAITRAMLDLNKAGVGNIFSAERFVVPPIERMQRPYGEAAASYDVNKNIIKLSPTLIQGALGNANGERYLRFVMAHELGHQFDLSNNVSANVTEFDVTSLQEDNGNFRLSVGDAVAEIFDEYQSGSDFGLLFEHPIRLMHSQFEEAIQKGNVDQILALQRKEIFAQAYAIYYTDPENFRQKLPKVHEVLTREITDERNNNQATDRRSDGNEVQEDIRTFTSDRSDEVDESSAARDSGRTGIEGQQADQRVGREGEQDDGLGAGRSILDDDDVFDLPTKTAQEIERDDELIDSVRESTTRFEATKSKAGTTFQKYLLPKGLLPETAFDAMIERDGLVGASEIEVRQLLGNYRNSVKETLGRNPTEEDKKTLQNILSGSLSDVENAVIPKSIKDPLRAMRVYLDNYSAKYATAIAKDAETLALQGKEGQAAAKIDLLNVIMDRIGSYVNRSYRAFDDKNWFKKVPEEVLVTARNYLEAQGNTNPNQVINTILKEGTAYQDLPTLIRETKLGAKDLSNLMRRKDIAPEIRALLGEYTDPEVNFARSATKMSRYIFNTYFLEKVLEQGEGVFLFKQEDAPPDHFVKIANDNSSVLAPLNGYYTTPEVNQAFIDAVDPSSPTGLYGSIIRLNAFVKFGKTVIAPTTMARNFMSAALFTVANGHFNWAKTSKAFQARKAYFNNLTDTEMADYLKEIKKLGVNYDSAVAGELIDTLKDSSFGGDIIFDEEGASRGEKLRRKVSQTGDFFTKFYQYGDDFWKIVGFENEVDILMNAKGITREEAMPLAAQRIRDTYPTYSLVGAGIKWLRKFPLIGTFVSFPYEIIRNKINMLKYLKRDMADPDLKKTVPRRIVGLTIANAGAYGLVNAFAGMLDVSEDEEEAIRLMAPPWSQNSNLLVMSREPDGKINYMDLSHMDPYAQFKRPLNAILRDQPIDDAIYDATWEFFKPFLGWDISTQAILEAISNQKESGGKIYNESDTLLNRSTDLYKHFERGMAPAVLQNLRRTASALNGEISKSGRKFSVEDEALAFVGFRTTLFDPKTALYFKAYEFNESKRESVSLLTNVLRDPNDVSDGDIRTAFKNSSRARKEAFERMSKLVQAGLKAGLTKTQAMMILRANNVTKADAKALVEGGMTAWEMSDSSIKNTVKKSDVLFGDKKTKQFKERFQLVNELLEQEI
ncbi:MAG: hypothetical protein CMC89_05100 [Flavobacteriaceae bacterium]|nr:hypothetical protein [Flavobacteriaceae bacterium]